MSTIQDLFQQAQLAEAAYSDFFNNPGNPIRALTTGAGKFSDAQAAAFVVEWSVVNQLPDTSNGFSGTLFRNTAGQYTYSLRGTADATDLMADAGDVLADGIALDQIVDMYNYWQSLTHTGVYQAVKLNTLATETASLNAAYLLSPAAGLAYEATLRASGYIIDAPTRSVRKIEFVSSTQLSDARLQSGSGLLPVGSVVNVDGHSLGGHLAMTFSRLFPSATNSVVAVNGAGFNLANANVNTLFAALGGAPGFDSGKITNVVGSAAMNVVAQNWLFLQQPAGRNEIFTESWLPGSGTTLGHGSSQMTDSLAVYALFAKLDPSLTASASSLTKIACILNASSSVASNSLEAAVAALGKLYGKTYAATETTRNDLYLHLQELQTAIIGTGSIESLVGQSASTLETLAKTGGDALAYRYALKAGNPFAVLGANYDLHNADGALELYDPATGQGELTERYLSERARLLDYWIKHNLTDGQRNVDTSLPTNRYYQDIATGASFIVDRTTNTSPDNTVKPKYLFGGEGDDMLWGGDDHDVLFGGAGMDRLDGAQGNDYLEGNAGSDILTGGEGSDTLYGGTGADLLEGGQGTDLLLGGAGDDTYQFSMGSGGDSIDDSDGVGRIEIDGVALTHGKKVAEGNWISDDGKTTFTRVGEGEGGRGLLIDNVVAGKITVCDWEVGQLGIVLDDETTPPVFDTTSTGEHWGTSGSDHLRGRDDPDIVWASGGDDLVEGEQSDDTLAGESGRDTLIGGADDDLLYGAGLTFSSNDHISGDPTVHTVLNSEDSAWTIDYSGVLFALRDGALIDDWTYTYDPLAPLPSDDPNVIEGNAGNDWILSGPGSDVAHGGDDDDSVLGMAGNDTLFGDAGNDRLFGDSTATTANFSYTPANLHGADVLDGGSGKDLLIGMGGDDRLYGGAGDDALYGDDRNSANTPDNVNGRDYLNGGDGVDSLWGGGGDDELYGGADNDYLEGDGDTLDEQYHGRDTMIGGAGDDSVLGEGGDDVLDGEVGDDTLFGEGGHDTLFGGEGNDELQGDAIDVPGSAMGNDVLDGEAGNDLLFGHGGHDTLLGGDGDDELLGDNDGAAIPDALHGADYLAGGAGNDTLYGDGGDDTLAGGVGVDLLVGGTGNDLLIGSGDAVQGADRLYTGGDQLEGGAGDDTYDVTAGDLINDTEGANTVMINGTVDDVVMALTTSGVPALAVKVGEDSFFILDGVSGFAGSRYRFSDGQTMSHEDLLGRALITPLVLEAQNGVAYGGAGNDRLSARLGTDTLLKGDVLPGAVEDMLKDCIAVKMSWSFNNAYGTVANGIEWRVAA